MDRICENCEHNIVSNTNSDFVLYTCALDNVNSIFYRCQVACTDDYFEAKTRDINMNISNSTILKRFNTILQDVHDYVTSPQEALDEFENFLKNGTERLESSYTIINLWMTSMHETLNTLEKTVGLL